MSYPLASLFSIRSNFTRSVSIERDATDWLANRAHYSLTPLARSIMGQAVAALLSPQRTRAWTITGPYGTGKSAFALSLVQLLNSTGLESSLFDDLKHEDPPLAEAFVRVHQEGHRLVPVLIGGRRGLLVPALKDALALSLQRLTETDRKPEYGRLLDSIHATDPEDAQQICQLYEEVARACGGLLVVIDELGKFLEYVAQRPDRADVFALQLLAEAAARSGDAPILLFTILHQAFARYGSHLTQAQRDEFGKVQGRFQDIAFNQSHDQMLRLVGNALVFEGAPQLEGKIRAQVRHAALFTAKLGLTLGTADDERFADQLSRCAPLHPLTALLLGPLFRRLAQNERSLFAFVSSPEPFGLVDFLRRSDWDDTAPFPLYTPDMLYDYIHTALGTALYQDLGGRRWAQVEATLDRLSNPDPLEVRIIKTVGLMAAVGEIGELRASVAVLALCFGLEPSRVEGVLEKLVKKSALVYRSFVDAYRLWEGSDVDIEERLAVARSHVDEVQSLDELLPALLPPRPIVARRHSYEKGTLRFFEVRYASPAKLVQVASQPPGEGDGLVIYVLVDGPAHEAEVRSILASRGKVENDSVVVIPIYVASALRGAALELERLRWVKDHTPELSGDLVAQREVRSRIYETEQILKRELDHAFAPTEGGLTCFWNGLTETVNNPKELNQLLSSIYDKLYPLSPALRNELINRRQLSSAATAARRLLIQQMLETGSFPQLGIEGHPPQLSMYLSLLKETKVHCEVNGTWRFMAPEAGSSLASVWAVWEAFLETCQTQRQPISRVWDQLRQPPIGLRDGIIPVLLVSMFLERSFEIGLYENGTFIPDLTLPHVERMLKNPDKFDVRYCPLDGYRREVFDEVCNLVNVPADGRIINVVRFLCRVVAKLPTYAQKTRNLPSEVRSVRSALMSAREPDVLFFKDLPEALGFTSMLGREVPSVDAHEYAIKLEQALRVLKDAHRDLHDRLFAMVVSALNLPEGSVDAARRELEAKVRLVQGMAVDLRMKAFMIHCDNPLADYNTWMEALGSLLANRPPSTWNDDDISKFESELAQLSRKFNNLVQLAVESGKARTQEGVQALRIGLTRPDGPEQQKVVLLDSSRKRHLSQVAGSIARQLENEGLDEEGRLAVLALLAQTLLPQAENQ